MTPDEELVTLGLGVALKTLQASTGAEGGVLQRSRNPRVATGHHWRGRIGRLLRHVGPAGRDGGGPVVLHVALVGLQREAALVLRKPGTCFST